MNAEKEKITVRDPITDRKTGKKKKGRDQRGKGKAHYSQWKITTDLVPEDGQREGVKTVS